MVDHHALASGQPRLPAAAHLNPKAWDLSGGPATALAELSAAGLAYLLFEQLARDLGVTAWDRDRAVILAGLGTVVDVMSLRAINRALVKEALRLANVRYGAGTATQLDVLTSQVALTEARLNQLQAYYGYNVAMAAMRQAIGQADEFIRR